MGDVQSTDNFFTAARHGMLPSVSWVMPNGKTSSIHPRG